MLKILIFLVSMTSASAAWDSVAVFHRPEKVVVQVNEPAQTSRLSELFASLGADRELRLESKDKSVLLDCGRGASGASCILRFQPSSSVEISARSMTASIPLRDLNVSSSQPVQIAFDNSNGHHLTIVLTAAELGVVARKK